MLQQIRDRITGWIAGIVLGLIALTFIFWGIDFGTAARDEAAKVDGEAIPLSQFRTAYQNRLNQFQQYYQDEIPDAMREQIRRNVIEGMVRRSLLSQRAEEAGYRVSDAAVIESIQSLPVFQVGGEFSSDAYNARLRSQGLSPSAFEAEQRNLLELNQLQEAITRTAFATQAEVRRFAELEKEQRELAWVEFPVEAYEDGVSIDDAAIEEYYATHEDEYRTPETVTLSYVEVRADEMAGDIDVSEQELEEYFASVSERYRTTEQRRARHILIEIDDDTTEEEAQARAAAVLERAQSGGDFAALAREFSDDTGTANAGGDLGWLEPGMFAGPFDDALFSMSAGEIRGPVRSEFGFHVIELTDVRPGETRTLDDVREELTAELKSERADDRFYDRAQALADAAFETSGELDSVAEQLDLELHRIPEFSRTNGGGEIGANPIVIDAAFDEAVLVGGENSPILELGENHAMVVRVSDHQVSTVKPLEDVRGEIVAALTRIQAQRKAAEAGRNFREQIVGGGNAQELAAELGLELHAPRYVGRAEPELPTALLSEAFRAERPTGESPTVGALELNNGDFAVYLLSGVRAGSTEALSETELDTRRQQLARVRGASEFTAYVEDIRADASVKINDDLEENADVR
ncbi:MAG: SurA N-terminal domain-containing protein [Gammaproteobacteria bacterium]